MKFEVITIKDIAKSLNLSTSTVSRALRDRYEISPQTKKLVQDYAQKMNYQPNPIAQGLKGKKTRTIGVLVSEIANSFFSQTIDGIEAVAQQKNYNVVVAQSHESFEKEVSSLKFLTGRSIDGLIISISVETADFSNFEELLQHNMPLVFIDRIVNEVNTHKVILNNFQGSYDATTHLIKQGYKRIAILASVAFLSITKERLAGYKAALKDNNIPLDERLIMHCKMAENVKEEVKDIVQRLLNKKQKPDAILSLSDKLTTCALKALIEKKYRIPKDIALLGFSNTDLAELMAPPLSVIRQPAFEMGKMAMELLLQLIESKRPVTNFLTKVLEPEIIIRQST